MHSHRTGILARRTLFAPAALALAAAIVSPLHAAPDRDAEDTQHRGAISDWVAANHGKILDEFRGFLEMANTSADLDSIRANASRLVEMLKARGLETRLLETDGAPYVFARLAPEGKPATARAPIVLFYAHFDGQPVDASRWTVTAPFSPLLKGEISDPNARLYGRSTSDDKGTILAMLAGLDALRAAGIPPNIEAKFIFDPEEEISSPHLPAVLREHAELLKADLLIVADGPVHQSGRATVAFGSRGIITMTIKVYGPERPLHSGHYGNWAPNPAEKLAALLASMKNADGEAVVEGFYDDVTPLSAREKQALAEIPDVDAELERELLIAHPDGAGRSLQELINRPSLNVRGMASAWVGAEARTIVPSAATAEIDLRLVEDVDPLKQVARVEAHVRKQGFFVVHEEPTAEVRRAHPNVALVTHDTGIKAVRTSMDLPISRALIVAVDRASKEPPVLMPTLGGTVPLSEFEEALHVPVYVVPIANPDNNQHSPDENIRLGNLWDGILVYASLLRFPPPVSD